MRFYFQIVIVQRSNIYNIGCCMTQVYFFSYQTLPTIFVFFIMTSNNATINPQADRNCVDLSDACSTLAQLLQFWLFSFIFPSENSISKFVNLGCFDLVWLLAVERHFWHTLAIECFKKLKYFNARKYEINSHIVPRTKFFEFPNKEQNWVWLAAPAPKPFCSQVNSTWPSLNWSLYCLELG